MERAQQVSWTARLMGQPGKMINLIFKKAFTIYIFRKLAEKK